MVALRQAVFYIKREPETSFCAWTGKDEIYRKMLYSPKEIESFASQSSAWAVFNLPEENNNIFADSFLL